MHDKNPEIRKVCDYCLDIIALADADWASRIKVMFSMKFRAEFFTFILLSYITYILFIFKYFFPFLGIFIITGNYYVFHLYKCQSREKTNKDEKCSWIRYQFINMI